MIAVVPSDWTGLKFYGVSSLTAATLSHLPCRKDHARSA